MRLHQHLALLAAVAIAGCLTDSGKKLPDPKPVSAYLIKSANVLNRTVSLEVTCGVPETCWAFSRTEHTRSANTFTVTVFARRTTNDPCVQVVSSINAPFIVSVEGPGSYTFRFWRYNETTVDTTLILQ